ncbi:ComEC/Rec2 family competence protein [Falsibacillus albus]|uniref:Hydrolase n=1 Tax=Falsibacillus albus TaxID=2478915 RepID=A0A3L7JW93_9BACI|nr:hypothetical protein [Falsibacillus albus]RLQ95128.1 hypothetical protein D9X91_11550 [Falsibacillus albus]
MKVLFAVVLLIFAGPVEAHGSTIDLNLQKDEFAISFLPLSDGEAAIVHLADHHGILINLGGSSDKDEIVAYLKKFEITTLDSLWLTNEGTINLSLLDHLVKNFQLKDAMVLEKDYSNLLARSPSMDINTWKNNDTFSIYPSVNVHVHYVGDSLNEGADFSIDDSKYHFLWMSSTSKESQSALLKQPLDQINIVKIANYAQKKAITEDLLTHIDPQTSIIFKKQKLMPNPDIMEMLYETWIDTYSTDQHGLITIKFGHSTYEVITFE